MEKSKLRVGMMEKSKLRVGIAGLGVGLWHQTAQKPKETPEQG